jgi:hypothetical protein
VRTLTTVCPIHNGNILANTLMLPSVLRGS